MSRECDPGFPPFTNESVERPDSIKHILSLIWRDVFIGDAPVWLVRDLHSFVPKTEATCRATYLMQGVTKFTVAKACVHLGVLS